MKHLYSYNYSLGFRNFLVTNIDDFGLLRSSDLLLTPLTQKALYVWPIILSMYPETDSPQRFYVTQSC